MKRRNFLFMLFVAPIAGVIAALSSKKENLGEWMRKDAPRNIHTTYHGDGTMTERSMTEAELNKAMDDFMAGKLEGQYITRRAV